MFKVKILSLIKGMALGIVMSLAAWGCAMPQAGAAGSPAAVKSEPLSSGRTVVNGESFDFADYPQFVQSMANGRTSYLSKPWNYEKSYNSSRAYPLVVFLHGATPEARLDWHFSQYLGNGDGGIAQKFKSNYPSFVYFPFVKAGGSFELEIDSLISEIEQLVLENRVDPERIYLVGYQTGSEAALELTRRFNNNDRGFAAVVKLSGRTTLNLTEDMKQALSQSSVWFNTANQDTTQCYDAALNSYDLLKAHYTEGKESSAASTSTLITSGVVRDIYYETKTVTLEGREKVKLSVYGDGANGVSNGDLFSTPYQNPELFAWLFDQRRFVKEQFAAVDDPQMVAFSENGRTYHVRKPWNYDKPHNSNRSYPLVIYLHGSTPEVRVDWHFPLLLGNGPDHRAVKFRKDYPSFVYFPFASQPSSSHAPDVDAMISDIERLISENRIDTDRIYLIGFSMGSGGVIDLSRAFNNSSRAFAGVLRLSGWTPLTMTEDVQQAFSRSSVWHISSGADYQPSHDAAITSFQLFRDNYSSGVYNLANSRGDFIINGINRNLPYRTETLTVDGKEKARVTIYDANNTVTVPKTHNGVTKDYGVMGHLELSQSAYYNPEHLTWLFSRRLK